MANTFTELLYHCVFSTKDRQPLIGASIKEAVWSIVAATAKTHGMHACRVGGMDDHLHVLLNIPKTMTVSEALKQLKAGSSHAVNLAGLTGAKRFAWQDGYAAFTVSTSVAPEIIAYIASQREHHKKRTFQEEYVAFLEKHGVAYDSRYLWG